MDEQPDNQTDIEREAEPEGPRAGERLAEARQALQITVHEIAKELHLDDAKVEALERNEFEILGAPVFAKGHLKKYAQLVKVNSDDVLTDYYRLTRAVSMPPVISLRPRPRQELSPGPWIAVIVAIVVAVSAYWWITVRPAPTRVDVAPAIEEQAPAQTIIALPDAGETSADADAGSEPTAAQRAEPEAPVATPATPQSESAPSSGAGTNQLLLLVTYTGDCWTDISDATGRRLFFGLGKDGRTVELSGEAPFNALFGVADNVLLKVNGEDYPIPASGRRGDTARMVIAGD
ncbi:MAG TPA: RodZ domain-containing protein [Woeseiaceae bacterium]